jgi:hypothetical protein
MKRFHYSAALVFSIAWLSSSTAQAGQPGSTNRPPEIENLWPSVQLTNGLTLGLSAIRVGTGTNTTEIPLGLILKDPVRTSSTIYTPKDEYLARMKLYDSNNVPVVKTALGRKYGQKFDELSHWDRKFASRPHGRPAMVPIGQDWEYACVLPAVSQLFDITKPGVYRLEMEVQVMVLYLGKHQVRQISRFPPIKLNVVKPSAKQEVSPE